MTTATPENRPNAPGDLGVLQAFMNSGHLHHVPGVTPDLAEEVRSLREAGASRALVAREFGLGQMFVSALARGASVVDELGTRAEAAGWLVAHGLLAHGVGLTDGGLQHLHELRELLRTLALANNGEKLAPEAVAALNRIAARSVLAVKFEAEGRPLLQPESPDDPVAALLAMVFEASRAGTWVRLKRCTGDGCPHTFYDASRNRTGTWCSMSVCGNRRKVRNYQQRQRKVRPTLPA